jgi:glycosyltransferase involved in cell wall biosynthesis
LRECQRRSILEADAVACVSQVSQRDVRRELGRECPIIGNGVDVARFAPDIALEERTRSRFGIAPGEPVVLSVGGVEPRKNSFCALEAMVPLLRQHPRLHWLIAGGASIWEHDQYRAGFRDRLSRLPSDLGARVVELGSVSEQELTGLYAISQILLCPSLQEGFGLCVLEAMAARSAVVVSEGEPFSEYLTTDVACFVQPSSRASIQAGVARLLDDTTLRERLALRGEEHARKLDWERVALEHERLYARTLFQTSRRWIAPPEDLAHA